MVASISCTRAGPTSVFLIIHSFGNLQATACTHVVTLVFLRMGILTALSRVIVVAMFLC